MTVATLPRLGFLGVGWIGRSRMEALAGAGLARVAAVADPQAEALEAAATTAPEAARAGSLQELLEHDLDGLVIATPSALHAEQAVAALEHGLAVFCQKPLARDAAETRRVLDAARAADRLLAVDLSYRRVEALQAARERVAGGAIGELHTLELAFHNAYGPDKPWFTEPALSGGGCLIDLGTHLVDLALWFAAAGAGHGRGRSEGEPAPAGGGRQAPLPTVAVKTARTLSLRGHAVEDHALAELALGAVRARLACSWFSPAGRDCAFECTAWGSEGAVSVHNVAGSFYDFRAELRRGTGAELLAEPPDAWGGRAIAAWAERLQSDRGYDPAAAELERVAGAIEGIYEEARR